jgi:hypothetical protein
MTAVVLTSGTSWTVPAGCYSADRIMCLGAGGSGARVNAVYGGGGGGGAYAEILNFATTPGNSINIQIGVAGGTTGSGTSPTANTWFQDGSTCVAAGGSSTTTATGGAGGTTANSVGTNKFAGGAGGSTGGASPSGGGGGAAGPNGAGGAGSHGTSGAGDNGTGGAAVNAAPNGANGLPGSEWPGGSGVGSGSGSGGNSTSTDSSTVAGNYGAGGGGHVSTDGTGTDVAAGGVIVILYTPRVPMYWAIDDHIPIMPRPFDWAMRQAQVTSGVVIPFIYAIAVTPKFWFPMANATAPPNYPGLTEIDRRRLQSTMTSMGVMGLKRHVILYLIPNYFGVLEIELVLVFNQIINIINSNFYGFGIPNNLLIPYFTSIPKGELSNAFNAFIVSFNKIIANLTSDKTKLLQLFTGVESPELTLATNTMVNEFNNFLLTYFITNNLA